MAFFIKSFIVVTISLFGVSQAWSQNSTMEYPFHLPLNNFQYYFYDEVLLTEETESNYFDLDGGFTATELLMLKESKAENYAYLSHRLSTEETLSIWIGINPAGLPLRKKDTKPTQQFLEYEKSVRKDVVDKILLSLEKTTRKELELDWRALISLVKTGAFKLKVNQVELDILNDNPDVVWFRAVNFESSEKARLRRESEPDPFDTENRPDLEPGQPAELIEYFRLITPQDLARIKHQMRQNDSEFWRVFLTIDIKGKPNISKRGMGEKGKIWIRDKLLPMIRSLPSESYSNIRIDYMGIVLNINEAALDMLQSRDEIISISNDGEADFSSHFDDTYLFSEHSNDDVKKTLKSVN